MLIDRLVKAYSDAQSRGHSHFTVDGERWGVAQLRDSFTSFQSERSQPCSTRLDASTRWAALCKAKQTANPSLDYASAAIAVGRENPGLRAELQLLKFR